LRVLAGLIFVLALSADASASCTADAQRLIDTVDARGAFDQSFWAQFAGSFATHVEEDQRPAAITAVVEFWKPRFAEEMDRFWLDTLAVPLGDWWVDRLGCKAIKRLVNVDPDADAATLAPADRAAVEAMIAAIPDFGLWAKDQSKTWADTLMPRLMPLAQSDGPAFIGEMESKGFTFVGQ
jgi:hypothetical protein